MNLRQKDQDGRTAVWNACMDGDIQELEWLCQNGASEDVTVKDDNGVTPLMIACQENQIGIIMNKI